MATTPHKTTHHAGSMGKTTTFFVFHMHLFGGLVMLQNVCESLFFTTAGVEALPTVRIMLAAVMLPMTIAYDRVSRRTKDNQGFGPLVVLCVLLVVGLFGLQLLDPIYGSYALMVASPIVQAFLLAEFWNFANLFFTIRESKRVFPQLFAAASLGGIAAGFTTSTLAPVVGTANLLLVWLVLGALNLAFIRSIRRNLVPVQSAQEGTTRSQNRSTRQVSLPRRMLEALTTRPLVTAIVGLSFLGTVVLYLAEYVYFDVFARAYPNTDDLTEFIGLWTAASSGLNFGISFLLLPRVMAWLGVRNTTLVQPGLAMAVFAALLLSPMLAVAVISFLFIRSRNVIEETNEKFLYKGLAPDIAPIVRGRSEGAVKPIAAGFAAVVLYLFGASDSVLMHWLGSEGSAYFVALAGAVVGLAYIAIAMVGSYAYPRAIVERIRTRTFDPADLEEAMPMEGEASHALLREQLASEDGELVRFAAEYLYAVDPEQAIIAVEARVATADPDLTAQLLALLAHWAPTGSPLLRQCAEPFLLHPNDRVRAAAVRVWASLPDADPGAIIAALEDPADAVRREAIAALCTHWDLMLVGQGATALATLLESSELRYRRDAVAVLARLQDQRHLRMMTPLLRDPEPKVRLAAARTLDQRVDGSCDFLVDDVVAALSHSDHAVRLHLVDVLLRIGSPKGSKAVLAAADRVPTALRNRSAHYLAHLGGAQVEQLRESIDDTARPHGERLLAAKALALLGREERALLDRVARDELTEAYRTLRDHHMLRAAHRDPEPDVADALDLLSLALSDRRHEALEIVVEIVGFASQHPDFDTIRSYCFSADPVARAYAIEALEDLAERHLFELLLPFLTLDPTDEIELAMGEVGARLGLDQQDEDVLARRVDDRHGWLRACAIYAATRLGHAQAGAAAKRHLDDADAIVRETAVWADALLA